MEDLDKKLQTGLEKKLLKVLHELYTQEYGKRNAWAGEWGKCPKCETTWSVGWNWNTLSRFDACPYCNAEELLKEQGIGPGVLQC